MNHMKINEINKNTQIHKSKIQIIEDLIRYKHKYLEE